MSCTHHEWLVDPGVEIPAEAAAIHGVSTEKARSEGISAAEAVRQISRVLAETFAAGIPVLAFNASYDFTVLAREAERHGCTAPVPFPVIDPYIMDKQADRFRRGKRTLTAMAEHYGVAFENAHTSAADVMATLAVGAAVAAAFPVMAQDAANYCTRCRCSGPRNRQPVSRPTCAAVILRPSSTAPGR